MSSMNPNDIIIEKFGLSGDLPLNIKGSRWHELPEIFAELGFTVGVEVGVELGRFARCLARKVPNLKLYGIDPWITYDNQFTEHNPEEFYQQTVKDCAPYNIELIRKTSMEAIKDFEDESLDFVYIDGNHDFAHVTEDLAGWSKKVRKGGIISGHDYVFEPKMDSHAGFVVRDWTNIYKIKPWFVIDESTKRGGGRPSWFFCK